jgi:hypothetical protein
MTPTKFEDRLLTELRAVVAARPAPEVVAVSRRSPRGRLVLATGAVAATAAGVLLATGGDGAAPAYAVEKQPNGNVTVEIRSLSDAAGLQQKLRAAGIPAVVDYTPVGKMCRAPRGRSATSGHPTSMGMGVRADHSATFTIRDGDLRPGETLVINSSVSTSVSSLGIQLIEGPVAPCELVNAPPLPKPGPGTPGTSGTSSGSSFNTGGPESGSSAAGPVTHTGP